MKRMLLVVALLSIVSVESRTDHRPSGKMNYGEQNTEKKPRKVNRKEGKKGVRVLENKTNAPRVASKPVIGGNPKTYTPANLPQTFEIKKTKARTQKKAPEERHKASSRY